MFQLRQLATFVAAAETLSFTRAAQQVHLSQPSVTEQIQALEHSLGGPLFIRRNNRLSLTAAGERLAARARELLALADETVRAVRNGPANGSTGLLHLAAPHTLATGLVLPLLTGYAELQPGVRVVIRERHSSATLEAVRSGTVDLGLIHGWPAAGADVQAYLIARDNPVVVMPAGHALATAPDVTPRSLAPHALIATAPGCRYREHLDALLQQASQPCTLSAEADSVAAILQMVAAGLGVSVLPRRAVDTGAGLAGVVMRPLRAGPDAGLPICLLTPRGAMRPMAAAFADLLRAAASDEPVSAVDVHDGPADVAIAHQEQEGVGDVVGRADAAHRQSRRHRVE